MTKTSTRYNICVLITLNFLGTFKFNTEDVAEFLNISERQARNILNYMEEHGWVRKLSSRSWQLTDEMPEKAYEVLKNIAEFINLCIRTSGE